MSDFRAISLLKSLLEHTDKWELTCPLCDEFAGIGQKALFVATQRLKSISLLFLWQRYCKWRKGDNSFLSSDDYFHAFIADTAWDIAVKELTGLDKVIFEDIGSFNFKFK
jgi:hypothetical protein